MEGNAEEVLLLHIPPQRSQQKIDHEKLHGCRQPKIGLSACAVVQLLLHLPQPVAHAVGKIVIPQQFSFFGKEGMQNFAPGGDIRLFLQADIHGQEQGDAQRIQQGPVAHHRSDLPGGHPAAKVCSDGLIVDAAQQPAGNVFPLHSPIVGAAGQHQLHVGTVFHDLVDLFHDHFVNGSADQRFRGCLAILVRGPDGKLCPAYFVQAVQKQQILGRPDLIGQQRLHGAYHRMRVCREHFVHGPQFCARNLFHRPVLTDLAVNGAVNKGGFAVCVQPACCIRSLGKLYKQRDLRRFGIGFVLVCLLHDMDQAGGFADAAFTHHIDMVFGFCKRIKKRQLFPFRLGGGGLLLLHHGREFFLRLFRLPIHRQRMGEDGFRNIQRSKPAARLAVFQQPAVACVPHIMVGDPGNRGEDLPQLAVVGQIAAQGDPVGF